MWFLQKMLLPSKYFNAATYSSLICNIDDNIARHNGYDSLTKAERFLSHDVNKLFPFYNKLSLGDKG
jgi:hypothetical protein